MKDILQKRETPPLDITRWYGNQNPATDYRDVKTIYSELKFLGADTREARDVVNEVVRLRGGKSKTDILIHRYRLLLAENYLEVTALLKEGPKGSVNAYRAKGWVKSPGVAISRAAKKADDLLVADGWRGGGATPEVLIPECLLARMEEAYREVFHG